MLYNVNVLIAGIEKISLSDYKNKVATVIFTRGCNFRCPFCHNSSLVNNDASLINEEEIFSYLSKRRGIIDGVVISGGEPTLQKDLIPFVRKIKDMGYEIKLDTNGSNYDVVKELIDLKLIDYVAMDIKNGPSFYHDITGNVNINLDEIKKTINLLIDCGIDYEFRTTLVKEYFSKQSILELGQLIKGSKILYLQKFVASESCINPNLNEVNEKEANEYASLLRQYISNVELRSY